jgi:hypothetical protein
LPRSSFQILAGIPNILYLRSASDTFGKVLPSGGEALAKPIANVFRKRLPHDPTCGMCDGRTERNRISDQSYPPPLASKVNVLLNMLLRILPAFQFRPDPLIFVAPHFSQPAHDRPQARCGSSVISKLHENIVEDLPAIYPAMIVAGTANSAAKYLCDAVCLKTASTLATLHIRYVTACGTYSLHGGSPVKQKTEIITRQG